MSPKETDRHLQTNSNQKYQIKDHKERNGTVQKKECGSGAGEAAGIYYREDYKETKEMCQEDCAPFEGDFQGDQVQLSYKKLPHSPHLVIEKCIDYKTLWCRKKPRKY